MHRIFRVKAYEKEHGPHFNEEYARKAVMKMENEDGTRGPHWSLEETTTLASQYGIALGSKFNRYDWFVALNMVYSDYYRVIMNILITNIMTFDQLNQGDNVYIIEVVGTFKKTTEYNVGTVISVSNAYDEPLQPGQFQLPNQPRKKLIDVTIQCNGEQKKFSIPENRTVITDSNLGLTISTDKQEIVGIIKNQYNTYKARKESIAKCDEEMSKCQALLEKLDILKEPINTEDPRIKELQDEVNELKNIIKQASSMVPPPMKQMLPQNMQNVMKEVDQ